MKLPANEFRSLIETHQRMVFSIALRITGEYGVAEEVAQDVFLELYRGPQLPENEDHMRFWLRRVTVHRSTDALRRRARRPESSAEEWTEETHAAREESNSSALEMKVEELLGKLPEAMRVALVLRYMEEMKPEEIAALLLQPAATVKSNLRRGLELLRRKAAVTLKEYVRD